MLVSTANGKPFEKNFDDVIDFYKDDLDKFQLETQLSLLPLQFGRENGKVSLEDIIKYLRNLTNAQKMFMSLVIIVTKYESRLSTFGKFSEHDFQTRSDNCN